MKKFSKKALSVVVAFVFVVSMSMTALAAWSSYQRNNTNNGLATAAPTSTSPTISSTTLATSTGSTLYSGVDTTPVINGNYAYVLYNGGAVSGTSGGARLASYDVTSPSTARWNIQLDSSADNVQQLATPYLNTSDNSLYVATTHYTNDLAGTGVSGWKDSSGNQISSFSFPSGTTTIQYTGLVVPGEYWSPQLVTDITSSSTSLTGSMTLSNGSNTYNLGSSTNYGGGFTLYNNSSPSTMVPAGTYTLTVTINNSTGVALSASSFKFLTSAWNLYHVTGADTSSPSVSLLTSGYGQVNTHINTTGNDLYFGIYEGDRCYYQYDTSTSTLTSFKPSGGDDFYWAGAAVVGSKLVFGSDSGKIYVRPSGSNFGASGYGNSFTATQSSGKIRSSICYAGSNVYYTSQNGYVYKIAASDLTNTSPTISNVRLPSNTTGTPTVSDNGYLYIGCYNYGVYPTTGAVVAIPTSSFNSYTTIYSGDSVQASPVVYSNKRTGTDYVYFTTNTTSGNGYCYSYVKNATSATQVWNTSSVTGNYTLQGMAVSDSGYMVFGNDANTLYVIH